MLRRPALICSVDVPDPERGAGKRPRVFERQSCSQTKRGWKWNRLSRHLNACSSMNLSPTVVSVPITDDAVEDGGEILTLTLSGASGADPRGNARAS